MSKIIFWANNIYLVVIMPGNPLYEITVTLAPRLNFKSTVELFCLLRDMLRGAATKWRCSFIAELHASGVPHAHGLVALADLSARRRFLDDIRGTKIIGRLSCRPVQYEASYREYMCKSIPETNFVLGCTPIISDFHELTHEEFQVVYNDAQEDVNPKRRCEGQ